MEEEKAHQLYTHLQRFDATARHKKGLGFGNEKSSNEKSWEKSKFIAFRREGEPAAAIKEPEGGLELSKKKTIPHDTRRSRRQRDPSHDRSRSRDRDRDGHRSHKHRRRQSRGSRYESDSSDASHSRKGGRRREKRRRYRDRSRSRSRSRSTSRHRSRRHQSRRNLSRSLSPAHGCSDSKSRTKESACKTLAVDWTRQPTRETTDYEKRIPGFKQLTSIEKIKAKARYLDEYYNTTGKDSLSIHHSGLQTSMSDMKPTGASAEIADEAPVVVHTAVLESTHQLEKAHEAAIFGQSGNKETRGKEEAPTVGSPKPGKDSGECLVSDQVILSQKTTSWRERAAWMKERRGAGGQG